MTGWTVPDRDALRRIIFQLQRPGLAPPRRHYGADGTWHTSNGITGLTAGSFAALLDELDWSQAT